MKYVITYAPDIEQILVKELRNYFHNDIRWGALYANYQKIRISPIHPFAYLIDQAMNGAKVPVDLFPSITVVEDTGSKTISLGILKKEAKITQSELDHIAANPDLYVISDTDFQALQTLITQHEYEYAEGCATVRNGSVSIEIWADNDELKRKIIDLVAAFVMGVKRYHINESYNIKIQEESVNINRSGNYNFDFGKMLYGGTVTFNADYSLAQYFIDSEIEEIEAIIHTYEDIHNG
jgi:hypothetical protein